MHISTYQGWGIKMILLQSSWDCLFHFYLPFWHFLLNLFSDFSPNPDPFCPRIFLLSLPNFPSDPWDPELTSQDLLFQGRWRHPSRARVTVDVIEQLNQFLWDHGDIAFGPLGRLLQENFNLGETKKSCKGRKVMNAERLLQDLSGHQPKGQVTQGEGKGVRGNGLSGFRIGKRELGGGTRITPQVYQPSA
uniref:Uncharacterized protein n=1 Tax=Monodelphis domestica TaxID=13616 RepID=A0A5F8G2G7_MONDO